MISGVKTLIPRSVVGLISIAFSNGETNRLTKGEFVKVGTVADTVKRCSDGDRPVGIVVEEGDASQKVTVMTINVACEMEANCTTANGAEVKALHTKTNGLPDFAAAAATALVVGIKNGSKILILSNPYIKA